MTCLILINRWNSITGIKAVAAGTVVILMTLEKVMPKRIKEMKEVTIWLTVSTQINYINKWYQRTKTIS